MNDEVQGSGPDFISLASDVVAAYVSNNPVPPADLPALIAKVHAALAGLGTESQNTAAPEAEVERPTPAQIRKSVQPEGITSFIDGRSYKTLKRHLTSHGLDPRGYRARYGLPDDYPMVASSYAEQRSRLAREIGLGRSGAQAERQGAGRSAA